MRHASKPCLTERAVETARAAGVGPVTVWTTPDETHPAFQALRTRGVALARQPDGDLGARMLAALKAADGPALVIGTDCPAMMPAHLRMAAEALRSGADAVVLPAEDGGYVLIGLRKPLPALFAGMEWGTGEVMAETQPAHALPSARLAGARRAVGRGCAGGLAAPARPRGAGPIRPALNQLSRISTSPQTIMTAATARGIKSGSFRNTTARMVPNSTLVSRRAPTSAIGATVMAQIAIP